MMTSRTFPIALAVLVLSPILLAYQCGGLEADVEEETPQVERPEETPETPEQPPPV